MSLGGGSFVSARNAMNRAAMPAPEKDPVLAASLRAHEQLGPIIRGRIVAEECFGQVRSGIDLEKMTWLSGAQWNDLGAYVQSLAVVSSRISELEAEVAASAKALADSDIGGIFDVFASPADAITQMALYIKQLKGNAESSKPRKPQCPACDCGGYQCELVPDHDGPHRAVIGASDEIGAIPERRWHEATAPDSEVASLVQREVVDLRHASVDDLMGEDRPFIGKARDLTDAEVDWVLMHLHESRSTLSETPQ